MHGSTPNGVRATLVAIALLVGAAAATPARAASCDPTGADAATVADARRVAEEACDCASAADARTWRACVRAALAPSVGTTLSKGCARWVERVEARSTCGRSDRIACCRTAASGATRALLARPGRCTAPAGGTSCESPIAFLADACVPGGCATVPVSACGNFTIDAGEQCDPPNGATCSATCQSCPGELGCVTPTSCGDGVLQVGEECDPPNGTTCSSTCTACAAAVPGELLIGCTSGTTGVQSSAIPGTLLVAYTDVYPGGRPHAVARRLADDGSAADAQPLLVSGPLPGSSAIGGWTEAATADGSGFYVAWSTWLDYMSFFGGRRVPASGALQSDPDVLMEQFPFGTCRASATGPVELAPSLDGTSIRPTWRVVYSCMGSIIAETIAGVGNFFSVGVPGNTSSGPAPIARGASDVAAIWWDGAIVSSSPLSVVQFLAASFVEPGPPAMIQLTPGFSSVAPALAAVGDTFVALYATGNELRAIRFTRASGPLDASGGILLATAPSAIARVVATGDGTSAVAAWRESDGTVRAIRVAPDGTLPNPTPTTVTVTDADAAIDVAANAATTLVTFTRSETTGRSVRGILLPAGF